MDMRSLAMMFAIMIEIVSMPRLGTGANVSPLTAEAPREASSRPTTPHPLPASSPFRVAYADVSRTSAVAPTTSSRKRAFMVSSHLVALLAFSVPRKEPLRHAGQSEQQERPWSARRDW